MRTADFTIRPVAAGDFDAWKPLWDGYNAFYGREGATALPEAITRCTWQRFFDADEPVHCLVADAGGGQLLGLAHYLFHRSTTQVEPMVYLQDLFTAHEARGRGVGRALIEALYAKAQAAGCPRVYWHTYESNTTARALYDQLATFNGAIVYRKQF